MKKYSAEFIGTFVLVFGGVGSAVLAGPKIGNVGVALAFGLSLLAMVYAIGPISGCHVNPAVTLGLFLAKKLRGADVAGYWVAQCCGAIAAAGVLLLIAKGAPHGYDAAVSGLGANGFGAHSPMGYSLLAAFLSEMTLTAFLVFTVLGSTDVLAPRRLCRSSDRLCPDHNPLGKHPGHEHLGKPGAQPWSRLVRRRLGTL